MGDSDRFGDEWLKLQQEYWAKLGSFASGESPQADNADAPDPLAQLLDLWWQNQAEATPLMARELLEKMTTQGHQLFQLAAQFSVDRGQSEALDWSTLIEQTFSDLRGIIGGITGAMNPLPEEMLSEQVMAGSEHYMKRLFAFPGLGLGHRSQAQQKEMISRLLTYQKARHGYERFFVDLGQRAVGRLQQRVAELQERGDAIESARQLYDLWSTECESVYAEQVMTEEYVRLYGDLINSQMAVKQQMRLMMDDAFRALGMPTTRDVRNLEQRAHEDRRSIKSLQAEVAALSRRAGSAAKPTPRRRKKQSPKLEGRHGGD